ncbi:hypothetical protein [Cohnella abietis]|uniref:Uncharacterized protein n=1 Tax=Cohnella abietis TaxID=2507935 RepID=A0A3T1DBG1_9BACL|nr:hypothetical protein [Cohnella abietis]BBI35471.1 hypothetical protein KCTCHS21_48700 [Cohnella abietis]
MRKWLIYGLAMSVIVTVVIVWMAYSTPQYEFIHPKASKSVSQCPEVAMEEGDECYFIPNLNYSEAIRWHENKLSTSGWEGGASNDFVPFTYIYEKENKRISLIFYPANVTIEGNISTIHYDRPGVGLLIKKLL